MIDHAFIKSLFRNHSSNRKNFFPQISFRYNDIITNNNKGFASKPIFDFFFFFLFPSALIFDSPPTSMINKNNDGTNQHVKLKFSAWVSTPSTIAVAYLFPVMIRIYDTRDIYDKSGINRNQFKCVIYK